MPREKFCGCGELLSPKNRTGLCPACRGEQNYPSPSPAEIRTGCLEIQKEWSKHEERRRRAHYDYPVEIKRVGAKFKSGLILGDD